MLDALKSGTSATARFDVFHNDPLRATTADQTRQRPLSAHAAFRTLEASMTLLRRALDIVKQVQG